VVHNHEPLALLGSSRSIEGGAQTTLTEVAFCFPGPVHDAAGSRSELEKAAAFAPRQETEMAD
jgi:hypothetical protein